MEEDVKIDTGFKDLFDRSFDSFSGLDLSNSSLLQVIDEMSTVKSVISPKYNIELNHLRFYIRKLEKTFECTIMPYHITDIFWSNFIPYLVSNGLSMSSIKTLSSQLLTTIVWGNKYGSVLSTTFDIVSLPSYSIDHISLTPDEVSSIYHFNINDIPRRSQFRRRMEQVRDLFVLSCNLGQRYSDMIRIDCTNFNRNLFTIVQQKTGNKAIVDIDKFSLSKRTTYDILKKYDFKNPYPRSLSQYDKSLKDLLRYIGGTFNDNIKIEERIGGKIKSKVCKKWDIVTSHTARRTFVTYNYFRGINIIELKKATGHKCNSSLETYLCKVVE